MPIRPDDALFAWSDRDDPFDRTEVQADSALSTCDEPRVRDDERIRSRLASAGFTLGPHLDQHGNCHVYLVKAAEGSQLVAKVLVDRLIHGGSALARFHLEARLLAAMEHPHVVKVRSHGTVDDVHFMILEVAGGINLKRLIRNRGPMLPGMAAYCAQQAAWALGYLHDRGVIHRDVKPSNMIRAEDGKVMLIDLGLARAGDESHSLTRIFKDSLLGTPDYMAPEQWVDCHDIDWRVDLYGLGCTLYFLLTGEPPFDRPSMRDRLEDHRSKIPRSVSMLRPEVPAGLVQVCERLMAKRPIDRPDSAIAASQELAPWATFDASFSSSAVRAV
jgi:eukaryotic-like serine/threonine-protein kinase